MNTATVLMVPLRTTVASSRWMMLAAMALVLCVAVAVQRHQSVAGALIAPIILGYGEFFVGMLSMAPFMLMSLDAREMRMPRVQRFILLGMMLYGALWVLLPSAILSIVGAPFTVVVAIQTLGLVLGLAFGLLPRIFLIVVGFSPSFFSLVQFPWWHAFKLKAPSIIDLWAITLLLLAISALCWLRYLRTANPYDDGFNKPVVLKMRSVNRTGFGGWNSWQNTYGTGRQIRNQPQWLRSVASLRNTGPAHPQRSLRVTLGGWLLPKTWQSSFRQWSALLVPSALFVALAYAVHGPRVITAVVDLWHSMPLGPWIWFAGFTSVLLGLMTALIVQQRWSKTNAELPLLALLPGLGNGNRRLGNLLRASTWRTLTWQLVILGLLWVAAYVRHADKFTMTMALLPQMTAMAMAPAFALATFGDRALPAWAVGLIAGISFALVGITTGALGWVSASAPVGWTMAAGVVTGWMVLLVFLAWLGLRGWHGLQRRPHPFLPNG